MFVKWTAIISGSVFVGLGIWMSCLGFTEPGSYRLDLISLFLVSGLTWVIFTSLHETRDTGRRKRRHGAFWSDESSS